MKKSKVALALGLLTSVAMVGAIVSCKTTTVDTRDPQIVSIYNLYVQSAEDNGETPLTYEDWLASIRGTDGSDGKDGLTPYIGENGNWWIGSNDTGVKASGDKGDKGDTGATGEKGDKGDTGATGPQGPKGEDGADAPHANETCTVTFVLNGGTLPEGTSTTVTVEYGSTLVLPIPTNENASYFAGWFTGTTVNDGQFFNYTPVCSNLTLTAKWAYTREKIENGAVNVSPIKDVYYNGEAITVTPKEVAGKTFSLFRFTVSNTINDFESYSNEVSIETTVGYYYNFRTQYIDTPLTPSFAGTYIGEYVDFKNVTQTGTVVLDGYGLYTLNGKTYALTRYENGSPLPYDPAITSGYTIEDESVTFENVSFVTETKADGNEYTYFTTDYDSYAGMEQTIFWLDGNAYVEPVSTVCPAAGTYTATFYDADSEADVTYVATINEKGNGSTDEEGYVQTFTVIDTSNYPESFDIETETGDTYTITKQSDGTYKGRFGEAKSKSYTFEKYVFPFTGTFTANVDEVNYEIVINEDKTGEYKEDGIKVCDLTVTDFTYPESLTVAYNYEGEDLEKTISLQSTGYYKVRIGETSVATYEFTPKTDCLYAGTFEGVDGDDTTCTLVINADGTGTYYEDGNEQFTFTVTETVNDGSTESFTITDEYGEPYTFTKQTNGTFKGRINSSVFYTFTPAA